MLYMSRIRDHFMYIGKPDIHYGIFPGCGQHLPFDKVNNKSDSKGCC